MCVNYKKYISNLRDFTFESKKMKNMHQRHLNTKQKKEGVAVLTSEKGNIKGRVIRRKKEKHINNKIINNKNNKNKNNKTIIKESILLEHVALLKLKVLSNKPLLYTNFK